MKINDLDKLLQEGKQEEVADMLLEELGDAAAQPKATEEKEPEAETPEVETKDVYPEDGHKEAEEVKEVVVEAEEQEEKKEEISEDVMEINPEVPAAEEDGTAGDVVAPITPSTEAKEEVEEKLEEPVKEPEELAKDAEEVIEEELPEVERAEESLEMDAEKSINESLDNIFAILRGLNEEKEVEIENPELDNEDIYNKETEPVNAEEVEEVIVEGKVLSKLKDKITNTVNTIKHKDALPNLTTPYQGNANDKVEQFNKDHVAKEANKKKMEEEKSKRPYTVYPTTVKGAVSAEELVGVKESECPTEEREPEVKEVEIETKDLFPTEEHKEAVDLSVEEVFEEAVYQYNLYKDVMSLDEEQFNYVLENADEELLDDMDVVLSEEYEAFVNEFQSRSLNESVYDETELLEDILVEGIVGLVNIGELTTLTEAASMDDVVASNKAVQKQLEKNDKGANKRTAALGGLGASMMGAQTLYMRNKAAKEAAGAAGAEAVKSGFGAKLAGALVAAGEKIKTGAAAVGGKIKDFATNAVQGGKEIAQTAAANPATLGALGGAAATAAAIAIGNKARKVSKAKGQYAKAMANNSGDAETKKNLETYAQGRNFFGAKKGVIRAAKAARKSLRGDKTLTKAEKRDAVRKAKKQARAEFKAGKAVVNADLKDKGINKLNHKEIQGAAKAMQHQEPKKEETKQEVKSEPKVKEYTNSEKKVETPKVDYSGSAEYTKTLEPENKKKSRSRIIVTDEMRKNYRGKTEGLTQDQIDRKIRATISSTKSQQKKRGYQSKWDNIKEAVELVLEAGLYEYGKDVFVEAVVIASEICNEGLVINESLAMSNTDIREYAAMLYEMALENPKIEETEIENPELDNEDIYNKETEPVNAEEVGEVVVEEVKADATEAREPEVKKQDLENKDIYCDVMHKQVEDVVAVVVEAAKLCKEAGVAGTVENISKYAKTLFEENKGYEIETEESAKERADKDNKSAYDEELKNVKTKEEREFLEKNKHLWGLKEDNETPAEKEYDVDASIESSEMNGNKEEFEKYEEIQGEGAEAAKAEESVVEPKDLHETVKYTSLKEACALDEDYFTTDSYTIQSAEEKQAKLTEQVSLLLARESNDPMYNELLKNSVYCKRLQEALLDKYYTEAASRVDRMTGK